MYKQLLHASLLGALLGTMTPALAQNPASQPEFQLPTVMGPVVRPQNASASTMQEITGPSGATENLYIHSWDVYSSYDNNGIAWRRTDAGGNLLAEDYVIINYAEDIDAVIYEEGGAHFVLAAYYYRNSLTGMRGHYYDIYKFDVSGLVPVSTMNYLSNAPVFGRINVDATYYGLAITWCIPGTGIFVKVADLSGGGFGPDVLLPNSANQVDPDICIRRGYGGSNTGLDLQIVFLENSLTALREYRLPFFEALTGSTTGYTEEYVSSTPASNKICPPRIDCPDKWGSGQKWAVSMGIMNTTGTTVTEWIYAVVKNDDWPGTWPTWTFPSTVNVSYVSYPTSWAEPVDPVITYDKSGEVVTIGWISQQSTMVLPGSADKKYLAMDIRDDGSAAPTPIWSSYNMISNAPASGEAVLAFSGQNLNSGFDGIYIACSHSHPSHPNYCMKYKSRPFGLSRFNDKKQVNLGNKTMDLTVSPNPFNSNLSFVVPAEGSYSISLTSVEGRVVYTHKETLAQGQRFQIDAHSLASGTYIMNIRSVENNINKTEKLVKP